MRKSIEAPAPPRPEKPSRARDPRGDRYNRSRATVPGSLAEIVPVQARPTRVSMMRDTKTGRPVQRVTRDRDAIAIGAVPDPYAPEGRIEVRVNRRVDVLEGLRSRGHISVSEYEVGRAVQAVLERASGAKLGSGGWNPGNKADQTIAHELAIIYAVEDSRVVAQWVDRIVRALGMLDARLLRRILGERRTFEEVAALQGKGGERGRRYIAERFRDALTALDEAFAARGLVTGEIRGERQAAIAGEEVDAAGVLVPPGRGFRVAEDEDGSARWRPAWKRSPAQIEGEGTVATPARRRRPRNG